VATSRVHRDHDSRAQVKEPYGLRLFQSTMKRMNQRRLFLIGLGCLSLMASLPALAQLLKRNLTVEMRQVEEVGSSGYSVSTQPQAALMAEQSVNVRNGEKATLTVSKSMPMQWVQSVSAQSAALSASGVSASSTGGGVKNGLVWLEAGQSLKVQPRWPGGKQPVSVELDVESASVGQRNGTELTDQSRIQLNTTVSLPLGQWVTVASSGSGSGDQPGVYSSQSASNSNRLLQLRVLAP